jgi:predicted nucleic acid-binding protein
LSRSIPLAIWEGEAQVNGCPPEADARRRGRAIELRDLLILATAKSHALVVATGNVDHFRGFGVPLYNPFSDSQIL